jgi:hypothetical protein
LTSAQFVAAAQAIKKDFGLSLFGFDAIVPIIPTTCSSATSCRRQQLQHSSVAISDSAVSPLIKAETPADEAGTTFEHRIVLTTDVSTGDSISHVEKSACALTQDNVIPVSVVSSSSKGTMSSTSTTVESGTYSFRKDSLVVIDVNYFPSYKEVTDFPQRLRLFLNQKKAQRNPDFLSNSRNNSSDSLVA